MSPGVAFIWQYIFISLSHFNSCLPVKLLANSLIWLRWTPTVVTTAKETPYSTRTGIRPYIQLTIIIIRITYSTVELPLQLQGYPAPPRSMRASLGLRVQEVIINLTAYTSSIWHELLSTATTFCIVLIYVSDRWTLSLKRSCTFTAVIYSTIVTSAFIISKGRTDPSSASGSCVPRMLV